MSSVISGSGSEPPDAVMSGILHAVQSMRQEQQTFQHFVNGRLSAIERSVCSCQGRVLPPNLVGDAPSQEVSRSRSSSRPRDDTAQGLEWICPICGTSCTHRESFKGHVRLCVLSQHQRCRLMEDNPVHQDLLSKFLDGNWNDRSRAFITEFYDQVVVCSTSLDPAIKSHDHIFGWIKAAASKDPMVMLPIYSGGRSGSKRRRSGGVHCYAAGEIGRSSNDSSPDLLGNGAPVQ
jgi:hypothetical protein